MAVDDSCSGLEFRFSGTGASVTMQDVRLSSHASRFGIWVDGVRMDTIQLEETERQYTLAENLPQGPHTIRLVKLTEPRFTLSNFKGLAVEGELLPRPEERARKLEFIGDSLTAGFGNLGAPNRWGTSDKKVYMVAKKTGKGFRYNFDRKRANAVSGAPRTTIRR